MQLKDAKLFRQQAYVDGAWVDADNGQTIKVNNPATGEIIGSVPKMGAAETRRAIEAADKALPAWRALTAKERANKLRRWFDLMIENQDDLARLMTIEQGKPLAEAKGEIAYAASFLEWFGEEAKRIYGDTIPGHQPDKRIIVIKQPIGVTAAITPWNFPSAMITRKAGPALAAGCTMVLKPASQTPYSALALAELAERAGIPKGVFSVVTGSAGEVGGELTSNPIVRKLTFTGSTEIGRQLMAECAQDIKKVSLELGGNAPFIVFDDADLDAALPVGGKPHALGGTFFEPTILVDVPKNALVSKDETFGPLAPVFRFKDEAEVIAMSNDTEFGLASYFYARDLARVFRVAEQLEYGMVGINTGLISNEVAPFGGIKASGLGREGSKYGIEDYLEIKYLCLGGI